MASETASRFFRVKLYRGFIGLPKRYREWARTLGLQKRGQTNYVPVIPETMGAILKLKELLRVDLVDEKPASTKTSYPKGYQIIDDYLHKH